MNAGRSTGASGQDRPPVHRLGTLIRRLLLRMALNPSPRRATVDPGPLGVDALRKYLPDPAGFRALRSSASSTGTGSYRISIALLRNTVRSGTIYRCSAGSIVELVPTITSGRDVFQIPLNLSWTEQRLDMTRSERN